MMNWLSSEVPPWTQIAAWQIPEVRRLQSHRTWATSLPKGQILLSCSDSSKWKWMQCLMPLKSMLLWVQWGTFALFLLEVEQCRDAEFHCWVQQLRGLLVGPQSHPGEGADEAAPRLSAALVPHCLWECRSLQCCITWSPSGSESRLEPHLSFFLNTNVFLCPLAPFGKSCIGKVMPPGTGWRNRPRTGDGVRTFQAPWPKAFQTSFRPSSMFHPSRPGLTHVSDLLSWGRLNLLWASLWESYQNHPECHRCRCSRSTGTALVQVSCSVWSVLSSIWRSATQLIYL